MRRNRNSDPQRNSHGYPRKAAELGVAALAAMQLFHLFEGALGLGGSVSGGGTSSLDLKSIQVKYINLDCSSKVKALAPTKVKADYHLPLVGWTTGSAVIDKKIPLQWGECNPGNGSKVPAVFTSINHKVKSIDFVVPVPTAAFLGVNDLSIDECIPATSESTEADIKAMRAKYTSDSKAGHVDTCNGESKATGLGITEGTSNQAIEFSKQLADLTGYLQAPPPKTEKQEMKNAQRAMIAHEQLLYPGATIHARLAPVPTPFQATLTGWNDVKANTDTELLFSNIHFSNVNGQTELGLDANSVSGHVVLQHEDLSRHQLHMLNHDIVHYPGN